MVSTVTSALQFYFIIESTLKLTTYLQTKNQKVPMTELEKNFIEDKEKAIRRKDQRVRDMKYFDSRMEDSGICRFLTMVEEDAAREKEFREVRWQGHYYSTKST